MGHGALRVLVVLVAKRSIGVSRSTSDIALAEIEGRAGGGVCRSKGGGGVTGITDALCCCRRL